MCEGRGGGRPRFFQISLLPSDSRKCDTGYRVRDSPSPAAHKGNGAAVAKEMLGGVILSRIPRAGVTRRHRGKRKAGENWVVARGGGEEEEGRGGGSHADITAMRKCQTSRDKPTKQSNSKNLNGQVRKEKDVKEMPLRRPQERAPLRPHIAMRIPLGGIPRVSATLPWGNMRDSRLKRERKHTRPCVL